MRDRPPDVDLPLVRSILDGAVAGRVCPAAAVEVGRADGTLWSAAFGALRYDEGAPRTTIDTVFDLASLTKVIATSSAAMRLVHAGTLELDAPIAHYLSGWDGPERAGIQVRHLLDHSSGLPDHARLWEEARGRSAYEARFRELPIVSRPGTRSVYSDVGFMLLGFILEDLGQQPLDVQLSQLANAVSLGDVRYLPPANWQIRTAPTEFDPWRSRVLVGEVHDENAAALNGVAAHAGLFGTATAVGRFAQVVLRAFAGRPATPAFALMERFAAITGVPGSSRALGWDTMLPTSSCGSRLSPRAIGHTGFTGTSLWIDPEQDVYVVLLSNRVHPTRSNDAFIPVRPKVHDAVIEDLIRAGVLPRH